MKMEMAVNIRFIMNTNDCEKRDVKPEQVNVLFCLEASTIMFGSTYKYNVTVLFGSKNM